LIANKISVSPSQKHYNLKCSD